MHDPSQPESTDTQPSTIDRRGLLTRFAALALVVPLMTSVPAFAEGGGEGKGKRRKGKGKGDGEGKGKGEGEGGATTSRSDSWQPRAIQSMLGIWGICAPESLPLAPPRIV